ncbi:MAG: hypothetical protein WC503_06375 [Candidatus Shapirobacteria bacterium]
MRKIIKYFSIEIGIILALLIIVPALFIKKEVGLNRENGKPILPLQKGKTYSQIIDNSNQSLNSVSLQLKNPLIQDNSLITVELLNEKGELQKDFSFYGANVGDPSWIKLDFPPIISPVIELRISGESPMDNTLYLYADQNNQFDIKTTYALSNFKNRLIGNINHQIKQFVSRSSWHNICYLIILITLNFYLVRLINEVSKKQ